MGKEFKEFKTQNGCIPYSAGTICFCLKQYAKDYIRVERKMTSAIEKEVRDAVLVDAINYLGIQGGCDFALYTEDLYDSKKHEETVDPQCLLTVLINHYAYYMFNQGIVESVLRNNHMNNVTEQFDANDGAIVLVDFINYIAKRNDYDRTFTVKELFEKYKVQNHFYEMKQLIEFLIQTEQYDPLQYGMPIAYMFKKTANEHRIKYVSRRGIYHSINEKSSSGCVRANYFDIKSFEEELYAMAYAYGKLVPESEKEVPLAIRQKIKEMSQK